jgi:16S rRNA processing protein RimM
MTDFFELGRILKPQGIKGEVKAEAYTDDLSRFAGLDFVFLKKDGGYKKVRLQRSRTDSRYVYLLLEGMADRDAAERLRGEYIYIDRENAAELPPGHYYISDMIGMEVADGSGRVLGVLEEIMQTGGRDVYCVRTTAGGLLMFPSVEGVITERDIVNKKMLVSAEKLEEVAIYDI